MSRFGTDWRLLVRETLEAITEARRLGVELPIYTEIFPLLKEAIETIRTLAIAGAKADYLDVPSLRNSNIYNVGGKLERIEDDPPALNILAGDIASFLQIVDDRPSGHLLYANETGELAPTSDAAYKPPASIWHHDNAVVGVLADEWGTFRDDRVLLQLENSTKFTKLLESAGKMRDHREFVAFIVENFRDEFNRAAPPLLGTLRALRFVNNSTATGNIQQGRESLGREVENAITGADQLPETIILRVPRWSTLPFIIDVECLLKLDPVRGELGLKPLADQVAKAELEAQAWLHGQLSEAKDVPVYHGCP